MQAFYLTSVSRDCCLFLDIADSCFHISNDAHFLIAMQDPRPEYKLFGTIVHSGFSPESGHYYAYIKVSVHLSPSL